MHHPAFVKIIIPMADFRYEKYSQTLRCHIKSTAKFFHEIWLRAVHMLIFSPSGSSIWSKHTDTYTHERKPRNWYQFRWRWQEENAHREKKTWQLTTKNERTSVVISIRPKIINSRRFVAALFAIIKIISWNCDWFQSFDYYLIFFHLLLPIFLKWTRRTLCKCKLIERKLMFIFGTGAKKAVIFCIGNFFQTRKTHLFHIEMSRFLCGFKKSKKEKIKTVNRATAQKDKKKLRYRIGVCDVYDDDDSVLLAIWFDYIMIIMHDQQPSHSRYSRKVFISICLWGNSIDARLQDVASIRA